MSAFTTDPFHTSNCRCCEAHARTLTDLAALVELGKERDYAMEMVNVQDNQIDALRALLRECREDWIRLAYGASHEDVAAYRDFATRIDAALDKP